MADTPHSSRRAGERKVAVARRSARAILIDDEDRLLLIKRTKPGRMPYWTTPGGGVEDSDASIEAALHRELAEELGATAIGVAQVLKHRSHVGEQESVEHYFLARLTRLDITMRTGPEFENPARGTYDLDRVDLTDDSLEGVDLQPEALKTFILANRDRLLSEAEARGLTGKRTQGRPSPIR